MVSKIAKVIIMNSFNIGVIEYGTKFRIQRTLIEYGPERLLEYDTFAPIGRLWHFSLIRLTGRLMTF